MTAAENKAVIDRFNVALNEGNLDVIDAIFDPNFIGHSTLSPNPSEAPVSIKRSWLHSTGPCLTSSTHTGR